MNKNKRKRDIAFMAVAAGMYWECNQIDGVIGPNTYLDQRVWPETEYRPGVLMDPKGFLAYFGDDTNYEYRTRPDGNVEMATEVNGVTFYTLIRDYDTIQGGRLV